MKTIENSAISVVILAGGRGTRIHALYPDVPKPLIPVAGKPFLYWLTLWLSRHGLSTFIYSAGYMAEKIEAFVAGGMDGLCLTCIREDDPLGTGGAILHCLHACDEWIVAVNGDGLVMGGLEKLLSCCGQDIDGAILGVRVADASRFGSLSTDSFGSLIGFREKQAGQGLINGGVYLFRKSILELVARSGPCSLEYDLFSEMIAKGARIRVIDTEAAFIDIGTPETVKQADAFVRAHVQLS